MMDFRSRQTVPEDKRAAVIGVFEDIARSRRLDSGEPFEVIGVAFDDAHRNVNVTVRLPTGNDLQQEFLYSMYLMLGTNPNRTKTEIIYATEDAPDVSETAEGEPLSPQQYVQRIASQNVAGQEFTLTYHCTNKLLETLGVNPPSQNHER
jgi:hypothetical protein